MPVTYPVKAENIRKYVLGELNAILTNKGGKDEYSESEALDIINDLLTNIALDFKLDDLFI